jgi:hypothetical protein
MKLTVSQITHTVFYACCLFIVVAVCTMPVSIEEKVIHSFAWIYLVLAYAYFFDEKPPKFLQVELLYGTATEDYNKEYLDELLGVSQHSLSLMRKIQFHEDYRIVNRSIEELNQRYSQLKRLSPPQKHSARHQEILNDINGFLEGLSEGDYYLVHSRTK